MEGSDWTRCWGEVFRIYRKSGPGAVRVGDTIGIYYPREPGKWFGCPHRFCGKLTCPGIPHKQHGFSSPKKWRICGGEVFRIYARGKRLRALINSRDHVFLYYPNGRKWVGLVSRKPDLRTCPGRVFPPPMNKYDRCWGEVFELTRRRRKC